ncbi:MAG: hypothetical protein ACRDSP_25365, partial [Pseudonocardiaceae bacterium]
LQSRWLLPGLELALLAGLIVANPTRFNRESRALRAGGLILSGVLTPANAWSACAPGQHYGPPHRRLSHPTGPQPAHGPR